MLNLWDTLVKWGTDFKDWIIDNGNNPYFWVILFFIGLVIGTYAIRVLNKDK